MSDRTIRAGIRDLLSSGDMAAVPPDMANALVRFMANNGYVSLGSALYRLYDQAIRSHEQLVEARNEYMPGHPRLRIRERAFAGYARAWVGALFAQAVARGDRPLPVDLVLLLSGRGAVNEQDLQHLERALFEE